MSKRTPARGNGAKLARGGVSPLEFLLKVMRDENAPMWLRAQCAKAAAPYVHPRLAHIDHTVGMKTNIVITGGLPKGEEPVLDLDLVDGEDD